MIDVDRCGEWTCPRCGNRYKAKGMGRHLWACDPKSCENCGKTFYRKSEAAARFCGRPCAFAVMKAHLTHGRSGTAEYTTWATLKQRCLDAKCSNYHRYGGRGIKVCDRWRDDFAAFYADMGPRPSSAHSIDRINNDGDYEPGNCRWATAKEQARNRVQNVHVEYRGQRMCLLDACRAAGLNYKAITKRIYEQGDSPQFAFDRPANLVKSRAARGLTTPREMRQP